MPATMTDEQIDLYKGIGGKMAVKKMKAAHASVVAALDYPLFEFSDDDIRIAAEEWWNANCDPSDGVDLDDFWNEEFRSVLRWYAVLEIGALAWGSLVRAKDYSIEGVLAALMSAIKVNLRKKPMFNPRELECLQDNPFDLALFCVGTLRGLMDPSACSDEERRLVLGYIGKLDSDEASAIQDTLSNVVAEVCYLRAARVAQETRQSVA